MQGKQNVQRPERRDLEELNTSSSCSMRARGQWREMKLER